MHRLTEVLMHPGSGDTPVRTTLKLDDRLLAEAQRFGGVKGRTAPVHEGLRTPIERERARRPDRLGGSEPGLTRVPRRRPAAS